MKGKIIHKANPNYFYHMITTMFMIIAIGGYFIGLNEYVIIFAGLISIIRLFSEDVSIFIYEDRFVVRYSNYLGKLMRREEVYPFKSVKRFEADIHKLKASDAILITTITFLLPIRQSSPLFDSPKANVTIEYIDEFNDPYETKVTVFYRDAAYEKAFKMIEERIG